MNDKQLRELLLQLDASALAEPEAAHRQTAQVLRRDRVTTRLLTVIAAVLWCVAVVGLTFIVWFFIAKMKPERDKFMHNVGPDAVQPLSLEGQLANSHVYQMVLEYGIVVLTGSTLVLALAALSTVVMISASRRATLRQINASLLAISNQLKRAQLNGCR